jgi:hypothetical protein
VFLFSSSEQQRVPVGWLPAHDLAKLRCYAQSAAEVVQRQALGWRSGPVVLLGQWQERILQLMDELERNITLPKFRWTGERLVRRDLLKGLGCGPGVALYCGHGLQNGWAGYGGVNSSALLCEKREVVGVLLSIACETGCVAGDGHGFCEDLVLGGYCAAALGASGQTLHENNRALSMCLCQGLGSSQNLGHALETLILAEEKLKGYRIFGDPMAPFAGSASADLMAAQVYAPAPDELLSRSEASDIYD